MIYCIWVAGYSPFELGTVCLHRVRGVKMSLGFKYLVLKATGLMGRCWKKSGNRDPAHGLEPSKVLNI